MGKLRLVNNWENWTEAYQKGHGCKTHLTNNHKIKSTSEGICFFKVYYVLAHSS